MRIIDSPFYEKVIEKHHLTIGDFYFFENLLVSEVKEGIHLDESNTNTLLKITNSFFKNKPFGHVANRINRYSVSPLDFANYCKALIKVESFTTIIYNNYFDEMNIEIEKHFLKKPYYVANNLDDAFLWNKQIIENIETLSA